MPVSILDMLSCKQMRTIDQSIMIINIFDGWMHAFLCINTQENMYLLLVIPRPPATLKGYKVLT